MHVMPLPDPWVMGTLAAVATCVSIARRPAMMRRRRAIDAALACLPSDSGTSSPGNPVLGRLIDGARMTRWALAGPLQQLRVNPSLGWWTSRAEADAYDLAIGEARRALWDWLLTLRRLPPVERAALLGLGLDARPLWGLMFAPGVFDRTDVAFDEAVLPVAPDGERVLTALAAAMADLQRFEVAAASLEASPYR